MKKKKTTINWKRAAASTLVVVMVFLMFLTGSVEGTLGAPNSTIVNFELENPICKKSADAGTTLDELELPSSLRAVLEVTFEQDTEAFLQTKPTGHDGDYKNYGYVAPDNEAQLRESDELVIYTLDYESGDKAYRVYGTLDGANESFYACDENGNITGVVLDVPVTWSGEYDGDVSDTYTLTAQFEGYIYSGEKPTAVITVLPAKSKAQLFREAPAAKYTIDVSLSATSGTGWSLSGTTITFNSAASNNEYTIIKSSPSVAITRDIVIGSDVNNISIIYDGAKISMNYYVPSDTYGQFNSTVTINGGSNNSVKFDKTINLCVINVTINNNAENTVVEYNGLSNQKLDPNQPNSTVTLNNSGKNTTVIYDGVYMRHTKFNQNRTGEENAATMLLRGTNSFVTTFETKVAAGAYLDVLLSGSSTIASGFFKVPATANLTIDSADSSGSNQGLMTISYNSTVQAVIGSDGLTTNGGLTIEGGTIDVTQKGAGAAAIGGGSGGKGVVTINGGKVIAKITASGFTGAAIGGGYGNNGIGEVTINGGTVTAECLASGAAIGGGGGGNGNVTINGGTINAKAMEGAAIGGGRYAPGYVIITDGNLTVYSSNGAGVGNGSGSNLKSAGKITVNGGKLNAGSGGGAGVGVGYNNDLMPILDICHTADIFSFCNGLFNPIGGITGASPNQGDGYFVNLYYYGGIFDVDRVMLVFADGDKTTPLRVDPIPYAFTTFSYTTGTTSSRNDNVYLGTLSGGMRQLVRYHYLNPIIYSVNTLNGYVNEHGTSVHFQRVEYDPAIGAQTYLTVTEYHVDINGNPLPGIPEFSVDMKLPNEIYDKPVTDFTDKNYITIGYKWDSKPTGNISEIETVGNPSRKISQPEKIYFVYKLDPGKADVTISKQVTGKYASKVKDFEFTAFFEDEDGKALSIGETFDCERDGIGIVSPESVTLTLVSGGKATFTLKHGQTLTIKDVQADFKIRIEETPDNDYTPSFTDSTGVNHPGEYDTDFQTVGTDGWTFDFENERILAAPTGFDGGHGLQEAVLLGSILLILLVVVVIKLMRKRMMNLRRRRVIKFRRKKAWAR